MTNVISDGIAEFGMEISEEEARALLAAREGEE